MEDRARARCAGVVFRNGLIAAASGAIQSGVEVGERQAGAASSPVSPGLESRIPNPESPKRWRPRKRDSGARIGRYRCCLPALAGFSTYRRGGANGATIEIAYAPGRHAVSGSEAVAPGASPFPSRGAAFCLKPSPRRNAPAPGMAIGPYRKALRPRERGCPRGGAMPVRARSTPRPVVRSSRRPPRRKG